MSSNDATLSSPLFVPQALQFYVNRLSFSKNRVRLQALSTQVASANSQVIVRLPSNTMVNLASLTMTGGVQATLGGPYSNANGVALPTNWDYSFIETLSLIANGGIITQPFLNYKLLGNTLNDVYGSADKDNQRAALQGSIPPPLRASQGGNILGPEPSGYQPFAINSWISATQTMAPSYISTNLLGDLELRLTMAGNEVLATGVLVDGTAIPDSGGNLASWNMANINFYIETASIQSNMLEQAIAAKLAGGEPINVPFENVFSFSQANNSGTYNQRFSVSSQSVNKIVAVSQLLSDLEANGGQRSTTNGIPNCFRRNSINNRFCQFSVNNQYSPNYQIDSQVVNGLNLAAEAITDVAAIENYQSSNNLVEVRAAMDTVDYDYDVTDKLCTTTQHPQEYFGAGFVFDPAPGYVQPPSDSLIDPVDGSLNLTTFFRPYVYRSPLDTFLQDKFIMATSFDLDVCDKDRLVSGINTLGSNAQMFLNCVADTAAGAAGVSNISTIYVLCTSMVQIYQGATLQIIQ